MAQVATNPALYTVDQVTVMKLTALRELGASLGLESISRTPKAVLQQMILDKIEELQEEQESSIDVTEMETEAPIPEVNADAFPEQPIPPTEEEKKPARAKRKVEVYISEQHRLILDSTKISKSEKMRRLWKKGMSIADIHRVLDTHYSFTYGVIDRYRKIVGE